MKKKQSSRKYLVNILAVPILIMMTSAPAFTSQWGPEEMRGKVTSVAANRIQIEMGQKEWLPRAGTALKLGAEMAGMFVPLKGNFVIIQVNADNVVGQAVGADTHGTPAAGMLAIIQTPYPNHPQRRADYTAAVDATRPPLSTVLSMAQGGDPNAQHVLAMSYEQIGDHDNALSWWQEANRGSNEPTVIGNSAMGISRILENRGELRSAVAVLKDAVSRTAPSDGEKSFEAYRATGSKVNKHIGLLQNLGHIYRSKLNDIAESKRWYRDAANVMGAAATTGAPGPGHQHYKDHLNLLMDLAGLYEYALEDPQAAVPWLQMAARQGHASAVKKLTDKGLRW